RPRLSSVDSRRRPGVDCGDQPDGLRRVICDQPGADLLAADLRDLSAEDPRSGAGHGGDVQLGIEPGRLADVSAAARASRPELDLLALRAADSSRVGVLLFPGAGDQGTNA